MRVVLRTGFNGIGPQIQVNLLENDPTLSDIEFLLK